MMASNWGSLILDGVNPTGKEIGRGAYGRVFEVNYEGTLCAAKELHTLLLQYAQGEDLQKIKNDFLSECQIWSTLRHPCIVQFLGVYYPAMDQYRLPVMVMEKMQHSLRDLVEKYDHIPLNVKLSILDEVCLGLRYLHSRNPPIIHRDLTPNNILLGYHLEVKITDLGVAKAVKTDNQKTMTKLPGTPDFMPPEALSKRPVYGPSLDVFSYGGVILNVITQLWPEPTDRAQLNPDTDVWEIISEVKRRQEYLDKVTGGAADLKPLVTSCLNDSPKNRPSVAQVSMIIKRIKDVCSQKSGRDGMSPIVWWAEMSNERQSQVTSSLTTALEELRRENDVLTAEVTQLKTSNATMKNENKQLTTLLDKMAASNENQMQQMNFMSRENATMKHENKQLRTDNATMKDENERMRTDNATMKHENKQLRTDNATMKDENERLRTDNATMKDENERIRTDNATMKHENKQLRTDKATMKDENEQLRTDNATMKDEIGQLKTENDMIKAENVQLKTHRFDTSRSLRRPPDPLKAIEHKLKQQLVLKESTTPGDLFSGPVNIKWKEGAPAPRGLGGHTAVWLNGLVYVGGGHERISPSYNIICYDPVNKSWRSPINTPYNFFAMTTLNNKLLIAGGQDEYLMRTNQLLTMNVGQLKNYTKMTTARSHASATGHQGMLIITGGEGDMHNTLSSTELFDSNNCQWYICSDLPQPHRLLQSVIVDNILYLLGGINKDHNSSPAVFTAPLDTLSRHKLSWKTYQDTPCRRSAPVSVHGTHLLIVGGWKRIGGKNTATSDVYKLNRVSHSWEAIGDFPSARYAAAAVSTADKVNVIGGVNDKKQLTDTVWIGSCEPQ